MSRSIPRTVRPRPFLLPLLLSACASAGGPLPDRPVPEVTGYAGVPGFDTRAYPGDPAMAQWRAHSPYRWVGYYLPAPCYTGTSWRGRRDALERMGWGTAVLFVGEQDWAAGSAPPPDSVPARCTRANLSADRGRADGGEAVMAAEREGFPSGTVLFLDVERVDSVSSPLSAYVEAWAGAVIEGGYEPGLYAHGRNARSLVGALERASRRAGRGGPARLWVATAEGFDLTHPPTASGFDGASVWQGAFDVVERWGEASLRIDRNVADSPSPSAPLGW